MLLKAGLQPLEDLVGIVRAGLHDVNLLEAPAQGLVLVKNAAVFLESGGTDAAQLARAEQRLEQVAGIHHTAGGGAGANNGVHLIDEKDGVLAFLQLGQQALEALLKIAPVLGARQQGTQIQGIHHAVLENIRHVAIDYFLGQAFDDGCFAHAGLAHQQRVVLAPAGQYLGHPLHFGKTPDQRIDMARCGLFVEVGGETVQWVGLALLRTLLVTARLPGSGGSPSLDTLEMPWVM